MNELWLREDLKHEWRMWIFERPCVIDKTTAIRFACWSVRQVWHLLTDERSRTAIETVERFSDGKATIAEVEFARVAADVARVAADADAAARAVDVARVAADAAARAARAAYATYAVDAADAAAYAVDAAARAAARAAQDRWLIANAKPNFEKESK